MHGDIELLNSRKFADLRRLWVAEGLGTPPRLCRRFLAALLAYKQQETAYGGLSPVAVRQLKEIAGETGRSPNVSRFVDARIKPGTRLQCEWRGELHEVTALESRFAYRGKAYPNLSVIARLITGIRRSGPAFFGLKHLAQPLSKRLQDR
jgi:hypothetical protein